MSKVYLDNDKMPMALDVVAVLLKQRSVDVKAGKPYSNYVLREFRDDKSMDVNGRPVESPQMAIPSRDLDLAADSLDTRNVIAMQIEQKLGVPHLPPIDLANIKARPVKSLVEVNARLEKMRRKAREELKTIRALGAADITEAQNPATLGALEALAWLFNNGDGRDFASIMRHLFSRTLAREREKLFHIRRHPNQRALHVCHDDSILEEIKVLQWVIDSNPLDEVAHAAYGGYFGQSRF